MKNIVVTSKRPEPVLMAVVASGGVGLFLRHEDRPKAACRYIRDGRVETVNFPLDMLAKEPGRAPIYSGDTIEITF